MLHLHILRHAKTHQHSATGRDFDRELMPRGHRQCEELQKHFAKLSVDLVLVSTAKRTQQTFSSIQGAIDSKRINHLENLYLADTMDLFHLLSKLDKTPSVLIIGHNYGLEELVNYLIDGRHVLQTAGYMHLTLDISEWGEITAGIGTLVSSYRPAVQ